MSGGFEDLGLLPELVRGTQECGWVLPSDVQDEAIPLLLGGGDVMVAAETGSGKTGAFALPAIQICHETRRAAAAARAASQSTTHPAPSTLPAPTATAITLNTNDRSPLMAVSADGLVCQCRQERDWGGVRATAGVVSGKFCFEAKVNDDGLCRFGWSSMAGSLDLGTDRNGFGFGATGKRSNAGKFEPYGEPFTAGDVIGCFLDLRPDGGSVSFFKNGKPLGTAFALPKHAGPLYPAVCVRNAEASVNFGASTFAFPPPASEGYVGLAAASASQVVHASSLTSDAPAAGAGGKGRSDSSRAAAADGPLGPVCIIVEPARDLAEQTFKAVEELRKYIASPEVTQACLIGGVDGREATRQLARVPDIITATPGKLLDLVEGGKINLSQVRLLVLDEADRFTDEENFRMVSKLYARVRASIDGGAAPGRLQVCFFSATLHSPAIGKLADLMCSHPTWVDLKGKDAVPQTVHHVVIPVDPSFDRSWAAGSGSGRGAVGGGGADASMQFKTDGVHASDIIHTRPAPPGSTPRCAADDGGPAGGSGSSAGAAGLSAEEASEGVKRLKQRMLLSLIDSLRMEQCLIFCRTNVDCDNLEAYLTQVGGGAKFRGGMEKGKENAYSSVVLAGMRSMEERRRNLEAFRAGDVRFLICTDVAARGLDIKELPYVINMTLPDESESYIHRIGRVGRADRMGLAISLVASVSEKVWYHTCANRGKGCSNTRLKEKGGCTIWYDEREQLRAVQKRLGMDPTQGGAGIPAMVMAFNAPPPALASKGAAASAGAGGASAPDAAVAPTALPYSFSLPPEYAETVYGEERGQVDGTNEHVELIRDKVAVLAALELKAQDTFLALKQRFAARASV